MTGQKIAGIAACTVPKPDAEGPDNVLRNHRISIKIAILGPRQRLGRQTADSLSREKLFSTPRILNVMSKVSTQNRSRPISERAAAPAAPRVRLCFMASGGGHFQELCGLADLAARYDHILISTDVNKALAHACPFQQICQIDEVGQGLWKGSPFRIVGTFWRVLRILRRERPKLVISTGAGIAVPGFLAAKLLGIRTIYIESYARVESLSLAGKVCYYLSDRFLVQHACLASQLPHAVYAGSLNSFLDADSHATGDSKSKIRNPKYGEGRP
jgi:beta-1,4-N-acetylglucosaminyltransferase